MDPGPDADLDPVDAQRDQVARAFKSSHVPGDQLHFGQPALHRADRFHDARGMSVRRIDCQHIDLRAREVHGALEKISRRADGRAHEQAPLAVLGRARKLQLFLDVLDGDQSLEVEIGVDDQQLLNPVFLQEALGLFERRAHGHGHQIVLGHDGADGLIEIFFKAQVAVRQDAHQASPSRHRQSRDAVLAHDVHGVADGQLRRNRHRIDDHSALRALHPVDFLGLAIDAHAPVHEAESSLPRHGNRQARFGDGVHRGRNERNVQGNLAGQLRLRVDFGGQDRGFSRHQQHVVKRQSFEDRSFHSLLLHR